VAVRFIEFALSREGQHLWCDDPHQPGSATHRYALARVPIRQDFYPSALPVDPYALAQTFTYRPEWTGKHFNAQRDLVRVMCLDAGDELRSAWRAIIKAGMPPRALAALGRLPVTWESAPLVVKQQDRLTYMREWTEFFRKSYREAEEMAEGKK
jgi:hypothetical protein